MIQQESTSAMVKNVSSRAISSMDVGFYTIGVVLWPLLKSSDISDIRSMSYGLTRNMNWSSHGLPCLNLQPPPVQDMLRLALAPDAPSRKEVCFAWGSKKLNVGPIS